MPTFADLASRALTTRLATYPTQATFLGEHTHDARLEDPSRTAADERTATLREQLADLDTVETSGADEQVDAEVLRTTLAAELYQLTELDEAGWNPMVHNPGKAIHGLASRPFAPAAKRLADLGRRLDDVPGYLEAARGRLTASGSMSRVHVETAIAQFDGTLALFDAAVPQLAAEAGAAAPASDRVREAVREHQQWLRDRLDSATRPSRVGADRFRAKLAWTLDTDLDPAVLLARAEADVDLVDAQLVEVAAQVAGTAHPDGDTVRTVLASLARDVPTDETILDLCRAALATTTAFVRERDLVTVYDDPVDVIVMPEIDRGVAGAYCNPAGPLEVAPLPTQFAVSPTPKGWPAERVASYYREYNVHLLHDLTVHEAMPGHALQLMHSNRHRGSTPIRAVFDSGSFVEGWAVYAEALMADHGYRADESPRAAAAHRMHQLKMLLRSTLNTVIDIRYHCDDLDESGTTDLLTRRGYQEEGEAAEKWRRVQLTSTQLCTYYVGYLEIRDLVADVRTARPELSTRAVHDAVLAHGSPPARHVRTLLGL